jgi:hypothetical protein
MDTWENADRLVGYLHSSTSDTMDRAPTPPACEAIMFDLDLLLLLLLLLMVSL